MTKVIKGEFKKIKDIKVEDDSLACDSPLEVFNCEVSRLSKMDDDLFTYEVEIANIPCDLRVDDDSEHEADDMGFDPSDIAFTKWLGSKFFNYKTMDHYTMKALGYYWFRGDDEVELTDEEFFDNEDEIAEVFRIDTNIFDYETPICSAFNEFNYLLKVDPDLLTKDIMGFKTYDDYKDDWIYEWNKDVPWVDEKPWTDTRGNFPWKLFYENHSYQDYEWYKALEDSELKDEALRNKAIMEGFIKDDDDESMEELCEVFMSPSMHDTMIRGWIKYSFGQGEEYIAIKEDEYDNLARTSNNACRTLYLKTNYAVSFKEDSGVSVHALTNEHNRNEGSIRRFQRTQYAVFKIWNQYNILEDIKRGPYSKKSQYAVSNTMDTPRFIDRVDLRMTKVIKGEFEKIKDIKVKDDSLACDSPLEVFNCEVNDDSEHEADDMGFDPSDIAFTECWDKGDDEVELTDEEVFDNEDEIVEVFRIDTNIFDYETPICSAFNEFNYLIKNSDNSYLRDILGKDMHYPFTHFVKPFRVSLVYKRNPTA
ncbi:hypothetical protein Tco_0322909 [Tanacetum coccineum]